MDSVTPSSDVATRVHVPPISTAPQAILPPIFRGDLQTSSMLWLPLSILLSAGGARGEAVLDEVRVFSGTGTIASCWC